MKTQLHARSQFASIFLTNIFLLISSIALTSHYRIFFFPEFARYIQTPPPFVFYNAFFSSEVSGAIVALVLSLLVFRFFTHRAVALSMLVLFVCSIILSFFVVEATVGKVFGFFVGLSIAFLTTGGSGAASLALRPEFAKKSALPVRRPIGLFVAIPLFLSCIFLLPSPYGLIIPPTVILVFIFINANTYKEWGKFKSRPSLSALIRQIFLNPRFLIIVVGIVLVVFVELLLIATLPMTITDFFTLHGVTSPNEFISAILFLLFLLRTSLILFSTASLGYVPPRRLILYSGLTLSLCLFILYFVDGTRSLVVQIVALLVSAPLFPSFIQGIVRTTTRDTFTYAMAFLGMASVSVPLVVFSILPKSLDFFNDFILIIPAIMLALFSVGYFIYQYRHLVYGHESKTNAR